MIRKAVKRAAVMTAGAGLVLAPMSLMGPQLTLVACEEYSAPVATETDLWLGQSMGRYGSPNRAYVDVDAADGSDPIGSVTFYVNGEEYDTVTVDEDGEASTNLRRDLKAQETYTIHAEFDGDCQYADSNSTPAFYTVHKGGSESNPGMGNKRSAEASGAEAAASKRKAQFRSTFEGSEGLDPQDGKAKFTVRREGRKKVIRSKTVSLNDGFAAVDLPNLSRGRYVLTTKFLGNENFEPDATSEKFRVG